MNIDTYEASGFGRPAMANFPICLACYYLDGYTCRYSCTGDCVWCSASGSCQVCGGISDLFCCCSSCYPKGQCLSCVYGGCWQCGKDPDQHCCGGQCYNVNTQKCCPRLDGSLYVCDIDKACCNGQCCDTANCQDCNSTSHVCESRCKSENCKECDGAGHCVSTCDPGEECCNGNCYDPATHGCCNGRIYDLEDEKCCPDTGNYYNICDIEKECCNGNCCDPADCESCLLGVSCEILEESCPSACHGCLAGGVCGAGNFHQEEQVNESYPKCIPGSSCGSYPCISLMPYSDEDCRYLLLIECTLEGNGCM